MKLPANERKAQILKIATELFSELGYEGTKTSLIAREAGVNEALLFRHFTNKEELYWTVLENSCGATDLDNCPGAILAPEREQKQALYDLALQVLDKVRSHPQRTRLLLFAALEHHQLSQRYFRQFAASKYEELADYIRAQVKAGRFREDIDPLLAALGFLGMLIHHSQIQQLFGGEQVYPYQRERVAEQFVILWLEGMTGAAPPHMEVLAAAQTVVD
jgi:AcrR family transcriptional regulator